MKKVFFMLVCAVVALSASAQRASSSSSSFFSTESSDQPVTFGIRAGVNFANVTGDDLRKQSSHTGFHAGVVVDIPLMESLYIQPGFFYTVKGFEWERYHIARKASPAYLEIPILASYRYPISDDVQLQINFGPYLAYGIGGKVKTTDHDNNDMEGEYNYFDAEIHKFDMGLQIGVGVTIAKHYYVGIGYEFGLTKINKDDYDYDEVESIKNKNFFISVGYNF